MNPKQTIKSKIFPAFPVFFETLKKWKTHNYKLVFTNGCFDILHRGHADSLLKSASFGDKLIVGLNSDASVKMLKGPNRPVFDQESRAFILASLQMVDAVVIFDEETPYELIRQIQPDVLVKGNEYLLEEIAGYDIVLAKGGKVERIELTPGFSTSEIIRKINTKIQKNH
ncbi:MAG: D-glycero-beta-D-manno-heptose 1-phosphate adenylyltransferase [Prolixibacteraceae bacterium]|nr:D-glycero-beta-D-manno-heptose 1-phosphate adenylyltransferase [Prolixibacteraceae bacterium]